MIELTYFLVKFKFRYRTLMFTALHNKVANLEKIMCFLMAENLIFSKVLGCAQIDCSSIEPFTE